MDSQIRRIKSVAVTARILDALARSREPLSLTQLAQATGISPSRAHAYVTGMIAAALIEQSSAYGRYALGPLARTVGTAAMVRHDPIAVVDQAASALHDETQLTVAIAVWHSTGPTIVKWIRGYHPLPVQVSVGSTVPLTTTALGQVFLTYLPEKITASIVPRELVALATAETGGSIAPPDVASIITRTRETGFAYVRGTLMPDMCAIAAPIFEERKRILAVLSLIGRKRFSDAGGEKKVTKAILRITESATRNLSGIQRE
jgi:DNA-binding IclR family transcriptional regulator